jgi:hypothetical protein
MMWYYVAMSIPNGDSYAVEAVSQGPNRGDTYLRVGGPLLGYDGWGPDEIKDFLDNQRDENTRGNAEWFESRSRDLNRQDKSDIVLAPVAQPRLWLKAVDT